MSNEELADLIFPNITKTVEDYEKMYPERDLPNGAVVCRYAPSPTGFIHIGALLASFTNSVFAKQSNGVFYLRIEDTDTKRTVDNGISSDEYYDVPLITLQQMVVPFIIQIMARLILAVVLLQITQQKKVVQYSTILMQHLV